MIDENLPIFYFRPQKEKGSFETPVLLSQQGVEAGPAYTLRRLDPASEQAKNRYAVGLYDAFAPDVLYGEVLLEPEWSQPSMTPEGILPPPQPSMPTQFTVNLYDPDQQINIHHAAASWNSNGSWDFEMPQQSFRRPSASTLDRTESDPTKRVTTPMINMRWKRMGKFSKDLMCYLTGKSQNPDGSKRRQKEPDIPLAFFHHFSELTVYEPNVMRLDIEDPKGFEVVLLLAAATIRDVFFNTLREAFHIYDLDIRGTVTVPQRIPVGAAVGSSKGPNGQQQQENQQQRQPLANPLVTPAAGTLARKQWEIERETARLRFQMEEEERLRQRQEYEDAKRAKNLAKEEEKAERERRAAIEKETERLRKEWEAERQQLRREDRPTLPARKDDKHKRREGHSQHSRRHHNRPEPYLGVPEPDANTPAGVFGPEIARPKSSLGGGLNIFRHNDDKERKMLKKKSAVW